MPRSALIFPKSFVTNWWVICSIGETKMSALTAKGLMRLTVLGLALVALSSCGNTIRGVGRDMGNVVDATQDAGRSVANSVN